MGQMPVFDNDMMNIPQDAPEPAIHNNDDAADSLYAAIGELICRWGMMEATLEEKIAALRLAAGDVPGTGSRTKPTMAKMLAELRAIVSMRDRRNVAALSAIADMECEIQRIDRFRGLIVNGFLAARPDGGGFSMRDPKNIISHHNLGDVREAVAAIDRLRERFQSL